MMPEDDVFAPEMVDEQAEQLSRSLYAIPSRQGHTADARLVQNLHRLYELEQEDARSVARVQRQLEQQGWLAPERRVPRSTGRPPRAPRLDTQAHRVLPRPGQRGWMVWLATAAAVLLVTTLIGGLVIGLVLVRHGTGHTPRQATVTVPSSTTSATVPSHPTATATPSLEQHTIYAIAANDTVVALDAATGQVHWRHQSFGTFKNSNASLALAGKVLYIGSYAGVEAINSQDGTTLWQAPTGDSQSQLLVLNGVVYVGAAENLSALSAQDGKVLWSKTGSPPYLLDAISDGVVYAQTNLTFAAYEAATGTLLWQKTDQDLASLGEFWGAINNVAIFRAEAHIGDVSGGSVRALNARDGSQRWGELKGVGAILFGTAKNILYGETTDAHLFALDVDTGSPLWQVQNTHTVYSASALTNAGVFVGTDQGKAAMLSLSSGTALWTTPIPGSTGYSYPVGEAEGTAYIFDSNFANLFALDSADGSLKWHTAAHIGATLVGGSNGVVFLMTNLAVSAVNASNGASLWQLGQGTIAGPVLLG
jgi:outer membrane protein assembly factor BamB